MVRVNKFHFKIANGPAATSQHLLYSAADNPEYQDPSPRQAKTGPTMSQWPTGCDVLKLNQQ